MTLQAALLGFPVSDSIVVEDVPAGIRAVKSAGARVIAFTTTCKDADARDGRGLVLKNYADILLVIARGELKLNLAGES